MQATVGWVEHRLTVRVAGRGELPLLVLAARAPAPLPRRLYVPRGPACHPADGEAWAAVLSALDDLAAAQRAASVTLEPPCRLEELPLLRRHLDARWRPVAPLQPAHTAVLDLTGGEEAVLGRMRPKGRYNARLAARRGVTVEAVADPVEAATTLAPLCAATAMRQRIHQPDAAHIERVLRLVPSAAAVVARVEGEAVAGALVAAFAGEAIYLYGGSSGRHRERQPSALLHLEAARLALAAGCERYDLWGLPPGDDPAHPWHGLRQFKLSLGGVEQHLAGALRWVRRPLLHGVDTAIDNVRGRARHRRLGRRRDRGPG